MFPNIMAGCFCDMQKMENMSKMWNCSKECILRVPGWCSRLGVWLLVMISWVEIEPRIGLCTPQSLLGTFSPSATPLYMHACMWSLCLSLDKINRFFFLKEWILGIYYSQNYKNIFGYFLIIELAAPLENFITCILYSFFLTLYHFYFPFRN